MDGKLLDDGEIDGLHVGDNAMTFSLKNAKANSVIITFVLDNKYYVSKKVVRN
jgi:hypothetical protein